MSFLAHAAAHGLVISDLMADGRWHRTRTTDKPRRRNGAYLFDGTRGVVINFATMIHGSVWREGGRTDAIDRAAIRKMQREARERDERKQAEARALADAMVKRAALDVHPYLTAKGFPKERGLVLDGELLIPMREFRHYATLNSVQRIASDGTKLFLPGGKAKGSVFFIGPFMSDERWIVEGYATGLSVHAALAQLYRKAQICVCFSAGNLAHIGRLARELRPKAYVFADNDESGAGAKAAAETGLSFVMTSEYGDANDYHQSHGLAALAKLIRETTVRARAETA